MVGIFILLLYSTPDSQKNNDILSDIIVRMRSDSDFFSAVVSLNELDDEKLQGVKQFLVAFNK